jgi:ATP-dependent protease HslVU (ClpYQ) peptidase subunit
VRISECTALALAAMALKFAGAVAHADDCPAMLKSQLQRHVGELQAQIAALPSDKRHSAEDEALEMRNLGRQLEGTQAALARCN